MWRNARDDVHVVAEAREFTCQEAEALRAHRRIRREMVRDDENGARAAHASFRRVKARAM
jgi:hypothetical protein